MLWHRGISCTKKVKPALGGIKMRLGLIAEK